MFILDAINMFILDDSKYNQTYKHMCLNGKYEHLWILIKSGCHTWRVFAEIVLR